MIEPPENVTTVLSDEAPMPIGASDSAQAVLDEEDQVSVRQLSQVQLTWMRFRRHKVAMVGSVVLLFFVILAIIGPWITPETYLGWNPLATNIAPQWNYRYLMGSDDTGHAIMMYVILGARTSLEVGVLSGLMAAVLGVLVGAIGGYFGGWVDAVMMRVTDVFLTLPFLPLLIVVAAFIGGGNVFIIICIFGLLGWSGVARLIRSYYLTLREQEFTEAARAVGVSHTRIIFRHILPNALSPVIVSFTLLVASFILLESAVDFLGIGIHPPNVSWGFAMGSVGQYLELGDWWWAAFPGIALLLTVLAVNFIGDGLRDALDVRAKINT